MRNRTLTLSPARRARVRALALALAFALAPGALIVPARATVVPVAEDTYSSVTTGATTINAAAGNRPTLLLSSTHRVFLRFDLSALVGSVTNVTRARLTFYVTKAITAADLSIHPVDTSWQENSVLGPAPTFADAVATVSAPEIKSRRFISVDVTSAVIRWLDGAPNYGFALATSGGNLILGSKEGAATGYPATLEIEAAPWFLSSPDLVIGPGQIAIGTDTPLTRLHSSVGYGATDDPAAVFEVENCGEPCDQPIWTEVVRLWNRNENGRTGLGFYAGGERTLTNQPQVYLGTDDFYGHNNFRIATLAGGTITDRVYINGTDGFVGIGTTSPSTLLQVGGATCDGSTWQNASDRTLKKNITPVDPETILEKVLGLPISQWEYRDAAAVKHLGPMAQDFHAAFGLNGTNDKHIATVDQEGVALAAIQGLNQKLEKRDARLQAQEELIQSQSEQITELKRRLAQLEELLTRLPANGK